MSKYGLKVSKQGKNVVTDPITDQVFSSTLETLPIYKEFFLEYSIAAGIDVKTKTIKHGLSFVPYCLLYYKTEDFPGKWTWYPYEGNLMVFNGDNLTIIAWRVDKENVVLRITNDAAGAKILTIRLIVFAFPIALSI